MRALLLAGVVAFGWVASAQAITTTYDAVTDFSTAFNPNGVWSYGYGTAASTLTFTAFTSADSTYGSPAWNLPALPLVGQAYTGGTVAVPVSDLWLHPGNADSLAAILRFTAQFAGTYNLNAFFERADIVSGGGDGTAVSFYSSDSLVSGTTLSTISGSSYGVSDSLFLAAGDTLSFVVGRNSDYNYDSTGVRVTLSASSPTAVPEPASLALLGMGLAGIAASRRRRVA